MVAIFLEANNLDFPAESKHDFSGGDKQRSIEVKNGPLLEFHLLTKLTAELRLKIWRSATNSPRNV